MPLYTSSAIFQISVAFLSTLDTKQLNIIKKLEVILRLRMVRMWRGRLYLSGVYHVSGPLRGLAEHYVQPLKKR